MNNFGKLIRKTAYVAVLMAFSTAVYAEEKVAEDAAKPQAEQTKADTAKADSKRAPAKLWSWQPVKEEAVPAVQQKAWVRTPIDAFILAGLEGKKLKPSPE